MVAGGRELIDTLWNVNMVAELYSEEWTRINRYIMECKCLFCRHTFLEKSKN